MECELNGRKIKYESKKIWMLRETWGNRTVKNPDWRELKGSVAKSSGYRYVEINKKPYSYHRVVYFLHNQKWKIHDSSTDNSIDHIDRDKLNNNIENLRVVTHSQNMWNNDCRGYTFDKARGEYQAQIKVDGKRKFLGYFKSEQAARDSYLEAKASLHRIPP